jgi:ABC-type dipeptide/oligopeptide/nickel transport system permease component
MGGNPVCAWLGRGGCSNANLVKIYENEYHLNAPVWVQYYYYLVGLSHGDLGVSPSRGFLPVSQVISQTLPYTIQSAFFAIVISIILGVLLGVVSALYHHRPIDKSIRTF